MAVGTCMVIKAQKDLHFVLRTPVMLLAFKIDIGSMNYYYELDERTEKVNARTLASLVYAQLLTSRRW
jgi:hypothetical protein